MGGAIAHTCCQVTGPAAPSALTSPRHPPPASLFPLGLLHPGSLTAVWSYLKKNLPTTKQTKGRSGDEREQRGFPRPLSSQSLDMPLLAPAWLRSREGPPVRPPPPADTLLDAPPQPPGFRAPLVPGPTTRRRTGAPPSTTPRTAAPGRPGPGGSASAANPPTASGAVRPLREGPPGEGRRVSFAEKRPGAGRRTRLSEKLASGFAF